MDIQESLEMHECLDIKDYQGLTYGPWYSRQPTISSRTLRQKEEEEEEEPQDI